MRGSEEEDPAESGRVSRKYVFFGPHVGVLCPQPLKSWLAPLLPECLAEPITFDEIVQWVLADDDSDSDVAAASHERSLSEVMSALPDSALLSVVSSAAVSCFKAASSLCDELSQCQF